MTISFEAVEFTNSADCVASNFIGYVLITGTRGLYVSERKNHNTYHRTCDDRYDIVSHPMHAQLDRLCHLRDVGDKDYRPHSDETYQTSDDVDSPCCLGVRVAFAPATCSVAPPRSGSAVFEEQVVSLAT